MAKDKEEVIRKILSEIHIMKKDLVEQIVDTVPRNLENKIRNAYNEGFNAGDEFGKERYQKGVDYGIKIGADLAAMHGSDATSKQLEKAFFDGMEEAMKKDDQYQLGLKHAWEAARKVILAECLGGIASDNEKRRIFDNAAPNYVLQTWEPQKVIDKIRIYEEKKRAKGELRVGDEVVCGGVCGIVTRIYEIGVSAEVFCGILYPNGNFSSNSTKSVKRTGRHFPQIAEVLESINEPKEKE